MDINDVKPLATYDNYINNINMFITYRDTHRRSGRYYLISNVQQAFYAVRVCQEAGLTITDIAVKANVKPTDVQWIIRLYKKLHPNNMDNKTFSYTTHRLLYDLYHSLLKAKGVSVAEIARATGYKYSTVYKYLHEKPVKKGNQNHDFR